MSLKTFAISTHASDGDGNTQSATQGGKVFDVLPLADTFGEAISSKWNTNGSSVETGGLLKVHTYANFDGIAVAEGNDVDYYADILAVSPSASNYFALDAGPGHTDYARFELSSGTNVNARKCVDGSASTVGSFTIAVGDRFKMRIKCVGSTFSWYKWIVSSSTTPLDSDWVLVATDTITWNSGENKTIRTGSVANTTSWHVLEVGQVAATSVYHDTTGTAETDQQTWTVVQTVDPSNVTFTSATGTLRLKYRTRGSDGSTWSAYSAFMTIAAFQAGSDLTDITGLQFQFDANNGGQKTAAYIQSITLTVIDVQVTSVSPAEAFSGTIASLTITGIGFTSGAVSAVRIESPDDDDISCTSVVRVNDTTITCNVDLDGADDGLWDVVVTIDSVDYTGSALFRVKPLPEVVIGDGGGPSGGAFSGLWPGRMKRKGGTL